MNEIDSLTYFMAHAPATPWPWFTPSMQTPCPPHRWMDEERTTEYRTLREAEQALGEDLVVDANGKEIAVWRGEYSRQRDLQWPMFWALHMIAMSDQYRAAKTFSEAR